MQPMYLKDVENPSLSNERSERIQQMKANGMLVPQIQHLFAFKPDRTTHLERFTHMVMRGPSPLSAGQRELIAAFTSRLNDCLFWIGSHAAVAAELLGDNALVQAVLNDYTTAPISDQEKELFDFISKVIHDSNRINQTDINLLHEAGWSDEAIYDAITVCSLFKFYNTWIDATGVQDMPAFAYDLSGKHLATMGYTSLPPEQ